MSGIAGVAACLGLKANVHLLLRIICWSQLMIARYLFLLKLKVKLVLILSSDWLRYLTLFTCTCHHLMMIRHARRFFRVHLPAPLPACHLAFCASIVFLLLLLKKVELVVLLVHPDWHETLIKISRKLIVLLHNPYLIQQKILT